MIYKHFPRNIRYLQKQIEPVKYSMIFLWPNFHFLPLQMQLSPLDIKLSKCTEVVIRNIPKSITTQIVKNYIKINKLLPSVREFQIDQEQVVLKFHCHEDAMEFYNLKNFNDSFQCCPERLFNIHLKLELNQEEKVRYQLCGVKTQALRKVFSFAREAGICKLIMQNKVDRKGHVLKQIKDKANLSFARTQPLNQQQLASLTQNFKSVNVTIERVKEKSEEKDENSKFYIEFYNFIIAGTSDEKQLKEISDIQVKKLIKRVKPTLCQQSTPKISILHCYGKELIAQYTAVIECKDDKCTFDLFQTLRQLCLTLNDASKVRLQLKQKNQVKTNFLILFETNLHNLNHLPQKRYEDYLLTKFRSISPNILQVISQQSQKNQSIYNAKIYFDSEESGKQFLINYPNHKEAIKGLYIWGAKPRFNIWVDSNNLKDYNYIGNGESREEIAKKGKVTAQMSTIPPNLQQHPSSMYQQHTYRPQNYAWSVHPGWNQYNSSQSKTK